MRACVRVGVRGLRALSVCIRIGSFSPGLVYCLSLLLFQELLGAGGQSMLCMA